MLRRSLVDRSIRILFDPGLGNRRASAHSPHHYKQGPSAKALSSSISCSLIFSKERNTVFLRLCGEVYCLEHDQQAFHILQHPEIVDSFAGRYKLVFSRTALTKGEASKSLEDALNLMSSKGWRVCGGLAAAPAETGELRLFVLLEKSG
jgi:hypothetical protein